MLTSHSATSDVITGLDAGADDYLSKPFDYEELIARLHSLTRRNLKNKSNSKIHLHEYEIDLESMSVQDKDKEIKLSKLEFELLSYFAKNCGRVISRQELYEKVWGESDNDFIFSKTVDVYI
jgi:DNA-binding response OmpR family regulator